MQFKDKVCVVTGGSSGIGLAAVRLFTKHGARVINLDRSDLDSAAAAELPSVLTLKADVSVEEEVQGALQQVVRQFGGLHVMVNNAGFGIRADVIQTRIEDWNRLLAVNLTGVFLGCKHAVVHMRQSGGGVIVNTASVAGLVAVPERVAYCATKGAVIALTRAVAIDHAKENIRVNAVAPGTTQTPYFDEIFQNDPNPAALREAYARRQPIGRMGTPEEIAEAILWLSSDASSFVTGSVLTCDGGLSAQ